MTHPATRRLNRIHTDIQWLQTIIPLVLDALTITAPTGYPAGPGDGRGGSTSTSVETAAITHHAREATDQLDALTASLAGQVTELVNHVKHLPRTIDPRLRHAAATEAARARCTGGEGDWADPHCPNLEVRTIESDHIHGIRIGLCWTCLSRRRRWHEHQDQAAS
jgi:hypothetical protein